MTISPLSSTLDANPLSRSLGRSDGAALPMSGISSNGSSMAGETQGTGQSFGQFLSNAISEVNNSQLKAADMTARYAAGEQMDVHQIMIASQEASTTLNLAMQVRNKLVDSYQELMRVNM